MSRDTSRAQMIAHFERCCKGQARAHEMIPPSVPQYCDDIPGWVEFLPEEPMGNQAPIVPCNGDWAS